MRLGPPTSMERHHKMLWWWMDMQVPRGTAKVRWKYGRNRDSRGPEPAARKSNRGWARVVQELGGDTAFLDPNKLHAQPLTSSLCIAAICIGKEFLEDNGPKPW